jgi:hypothetical protein
MAEAAQKGADPKKGARYKAITNVSFGKLRPTVMAGETFQSDDDEAMKILLEKGVITKDLKFVDDSKPGEASHTDPNAPPANTAQTAAEVRGAAADAANADGDDDKSKSKSASKK